MRALFVLTPAESKRLIGKAVASLDEVKKAKTADRILVGHGSTNVYVAEEIMGKAEFAKFSKPENYLSGIVTRGTLCSILGEEKPPILVLNKGVVEPPAPTMSEMLREYGRDSIFIKGANAVDPDGNAAVFMAHPEGGTIGWSIGTIIARGIRLIVPVGLEKLIPSVPRAIQLCGQKTLDYCQGLKVGLMPLSGGRVVTEIEAFKILVGVQTYHVASGGNTGSEGSVVLVAEGDAKTVEKAIQLFESIKGEPAIGARKGICEICTPASPAQPKGYKMEPSDPRCRFEKKKEADLPKYLQNR